jgi:nitrogen fixation/metabolism regulation signal transduction histidine kinase
VARRLAHEIKNPLTPIQLSAERLERKLQGKLSEADDAILGKSVKTIVEQVDAMKRLVNEFRDYARLPEAKLAPLDLNNLIHQVLALYAIDNAVVPISTELDTDAPKIMGDAEQLRQVIHNLIQNAQDACMDRTNPRVVVSTRFNPENRRVRMAVRDNGAGFPEAILKRAFEPYVTTKDKGTGLGLAVVKKIADDHGARIEVSNRFSKENSKISDVKTPQGAQVSLSFAIAGSR